MSHATHNHYSMTLILQTIGTFLRASKSWFHSSYVLFVAEYPDAHRSDNPMAEVSTSLSILGDIKDRGPTTFI